MVIHWNKSDVSAPVEPVLREAFDGAIHLTSSPQAMKHWHGADDNPLWHLYPYGGPVDRFDTGVRTGLIANANSGPV